MASLGLIASREDVLTRAAALGRGAATTGFKRFLALTEAAKDRKDGPFRKLFNAWNIFISLLILTIIIFLYRGSISGLTSIINELA